MATWLGAALALITFLLSRRHPRSPLFPYTTLFRSCPSAVPHPGAVARRARHHRDRAHVDLHGADRKSTRLNSSHITISYAVFCSKKKNTILCSFDEAASRPCLVCVCMVQYSARPLL